MTKADLVERVVDAVRPRVTRTDCTRVIDAIEIRRFDSFKVGNRKACTGRYSGESVEVPVTSLSPRVRSQLWEVTVLSLDWSLAFTKAGTRARSLWRVQ